ncbi:DUF202 domain-containing protein [Microbacterium sp. CIAB417]|uniref:DUF202 domain-containing protein n=1 Tax=Microbacterium sp. CIAB417 TaxID=2860287 RepID=UPI001FACC3A7|nr:DUF202 domain-containing protein [Microbacterium sp. CIAB417]
MTRYDPGLQPERTQLAWRRTALSIAVVSLIAARALPMILGSGVWVVPGIAGVAASGALWVLAARRARAVDRALSPVPHPDRMPDGRLIVALVGFTAAAGALALIVLLGVAR